MNKLQYSKINYNIQKNNLNCLLDDLRKINEKLAKLKGHLFNCYHHDTFHIACSAG